MILHMMVYLCLHSEESTTLPLGLGLDRSCRNLVVFDRINFSKIYSESAHDSAHDCIFYVYILRSP